MVRIAQLTAGEHDGTSLLLTSPSPARTELWSADTQFLCLALSCGPYRTSVGTLQLSLAVEGGAAHHLHLHIRPRDCTCVDRSQQGRVRLISSKPNKATILDDRESSDSMLLPTLTPDATDSSAYSSSRPASVRTFCSRTAVNKQAVQLTLLPFCWLFDHDTLGFVSQSLFFASPLHASGPKQANA